MVSFYKGLHKRKHTKILASCGVNWFGFSLLVARCIAALVAGLGGLGASAWASASGIVGILHELVIGLV